MSRALRKPRFIAPFAKTVAKTIHPRVRPVPWFVPSFSNVTPGIVAIFTLGLFWRRATELGALAAVIGSFALSLAFKVALPATPFMDRVGIVFLICIALGVGLSYLQPSAPETKIVRLKDVSFATGAGFNAGAAVVAAALIAIYAFYW